MVVKLSDELHLTFEMQLYVHGTWGDYLGLSCAGLTQRAQKGAFNQRKNFNQNDIIHDHCCMMNLY